MGAIQGDMKRRTGATYERATRVPAPLGDIWRFHATTDGLEQLTPDWLGLQIESVTGEATDTGTLQVGARIRTSVRPFGVGPRQTWTSEIVGREHTETYAYFRDEMVEGPFDQWEHTHHFVADGGETLVVDAIRYELTAGTLGRALSRVGVLALAPMFAYRHRETRAQLG